MNAYNWLDIYFCFPIYCQAQTKSASTSKSRLQFIAPITISAPVDLIIILHGKHCMTFSNNLLKYMHPNIITALNSRQRLLDYAARSICFFFRPHNANELINHPKIYKYSWAKYKARARARQSKSIFSILIIICLDLRHMWIYYSNIRYL